MPRYYCDYCDAYLTHDSMAGRQQHMRGWKHRENFKNYYQQFYPHWMMEQQAQMQAMQMQFMGMHGMVPPPAGFPVPPPGFVPPPAMLPPGMMHPPAFMPPPMFPPPPAFPGST